MEHTLHVTYSLGRSTRIAKQNILPVARLSEASIANLNIYLSSTFPTI